MKWKTTCSIFRPNGIWNMLLLLTICLNTIFYQIFCGRWSIFDIHPLRRKRINSICSNISYCDVQIRIIIEILVNIYVDCLKYETDSNIDRITFHCHNSHYWSFKIFISNKNSTKLHKVFFCVDLLNDVLKLEWV